VKDPAARRAYSRRHARLKRERRFASQRLGAERCPKRWGKHACDGPLRTATDGNGRTVVTCAWCERHAQGLCVECPRSVVGRSKRCPTCKAVEAHRARIRYYRRHRGELLARSRVALAALMPVERARRNALKRIWRQLHPDKVRAEKRREMLRQPKHVYAYMRRYRAEHREHYRRLELARYYRLHPRRPDPHCEKCGKPITGWLRHGRPPKQCDACVFPCILRQREARRAAAAERALPPALPRKLRAPRTTYILGDGRHRCCGTGCHATLEGRTKKCGACKAHDRAAAEQLGRALNRGLNRRGIAA
jgi:hypothetical protein